jgi:hypothetical protein
MQNNLASKVNGSLSKIPAFKYVGIIPIASCFFISLLSVVSCYVYLSKTEIDRIKEIGYKAAYTVELYENELKHYRKKYPKEFTKYKSEHSYMDIKK